MDLSNVRRIFAFGCSFTSYDWPTWADLIAFDNPKSSYYNFGRAGMGNVGIAARISEANKKFNFCETDLVMVMWSTFCREDRWINGRWFTQGNVYNSEYDKEWIRKYADPVGYLIRDHAMISMTNDWLKKSSAKHVLLKSTPIEYTDFPYDENKHIVEMVKDTYKNDYNTTMPIDLFSFMGNRWDFSKQQYWDDLTNSPYMRHDQHPASVVYLNYLKHLGFTFTQQTEDIAHVSDDIVANASLRSEMRNKLSFLEERKNTKVIDQLLF